ncbi:MAG TPA: glycosyltransferase family 87 protein [Chthoniobacterales bacterium]|nr:glycosyltransferase family 87 protein [Chthoniobacterales bacterium]
MRTITPASRSFRFTAAQWERIALVVWAVAVCAVVVRAILAPHQNTVFTVFREAGASWLHGANLYSYVGKYLYSPLVAAFFALFAWMPESIGGGVWRLAIVGAYLSSFIFWARHFGKGLITSTYLPLLLLLPLSLGNLNNGQASLLVIGLLLNACLAIEARKWTLGAFLIAAATFFKIYPLVIGLLFTVIYPRPLAARLLLSLFVLWLLSLVLQKPQYVLEQYHDWFASLSADQRRVSGALGTWRDFWLLLRIIQAPITVLGYAMLQAAAGGAIAVFCWWARHVHRWQECRLLWMTFALGCLWITLFGPSTELSTYVFLAPSLAFAVAAAWQSRQSDARRPDASCLWITATYLLFIVADALNAWVPVIRQNNYLHALQPIAALSFTVFVLAWSNQIERSRSGRRQDISILE